MKMFTTPAYRKRYLATVLLGLLFLVLAYGGLYRPLADWVARHREVADRNEDMKQLQRRIEDIRLLETLNQTLSSELESLGRELKSYGKHEVYIRELHHILRANRLELRQMRADIREDGVGIDFEVLGSFADTVKTAYQLEIHPMPTRIDRLHMTLERGAPKTSLKILLWLLEHEN